jgi:cytochrome c
MKLLKVFSLSLITVSLIFSYAFATGNVERGKKMFNDPKLGTNGSTCNSCHPDGQGLEKAGDKGKVEWTTPAGVLRSLEDAINVCITMALNGKALDKKSQAMQDMVAYIKSLGGKAPEKNMAPGY